MSNPIKTSDIFKDDGGLDALIKKLNEVKDIIISLRTETIKINKETKAHSATNSADSEVIAKKAKQTDELAREMQKYLKALDEGRIKIEATKNATNELNKSNKAEAQIRTAQATSLNSYTAQLKKAKQEYEQLSETQKENTKEGKKLESQIVRLTARQTEQKKALRQSIKERELELKVNKSAEGSYNKLSAQYSLIKIRLNAMSGETRKFTKEGQAMEKQAKEMYTEMDRLQKVTGKNQLNVGNYTSALGDLSPALGGVIGRVKQFGLALKALLLNPVILSITLVTGALYGMVSSLKRSEEGQTLLNEQVYQAKAIWDTFADGITDLTLALSGNADALDRLKNTFLNFFQISKERAAIAKATAAFEKIYSEARREDLISIAELEVKLANERAEAQRLKFNDADKALEKLESAAKTEQSILAKQTAIADNQIGILRAKLKIAANDKAANDELADAEANLIRLQARSGEIQRKLAREKNQFAREALRQATSISNTKTEIEKEEIKRLEILANDIINNENESYKERNKGLLLNYNLRFRILEVEEEKATKLIDKQLELRIINQEEAEQKKLLITAKYNNLKLANDSLFAEKQIQLDEEVASKRLEESLKEINRVSFENDDLQPRARTFWDFIGIAPDSVTGFKGEIKSALDFAKQQLFDFAAQRTKLAEQNVQNADREVNALENKLQTQIELAQLGYANNVNDVQRQLALQEKAQTEALKQRQKAQQAELAIQSIEQATNLVTASTQLFKKYDIAAIPLIALMFGAFTAAKIKSFQLTKQEFAEGGYEEIKGGTHASGNDTYLGFQTNSGKAAYAERGESHAVFTGSANKKYGKLIPQIVESMNKKTYEHFFDNASGMSDNTEIVQQGADMSTTENELTRIRKQGERKVSSAGGRTIETYKSVTRYYR